MREFDQYREGYREEINKAIAFSGQTQEFYTEAKARCLLSVFAQLQPADPNGVKGRGEQQLPSVLDIGCGHGDIHRIFRLLSANLRLTGIDVASTTIEEAKRANPDVNYDVYDGQKLPYSSGNFDAAFAIAVMHHVPPAEWEPFLAEMRRVVRPGGLVAVIEHNPINPLTRWVVRTCPFDKNAVLVRAGQLASLFWRAGLVDIERRFILFTPFEGEFFRQLEDWLRWLPLGAQYCMSARVPV